MGWKFRKSVTTGPLRNTITHKGIGTSIRICGVRIGFTPSKDLYFSFSIPKTGIYYIKYFRNKRKSKSTGTKSSNKKSR
ncbi:MAG: DUF4236 domain-containing protein [Methanomicrobiales archaeon]|nr:DUF4236 domain-containing protein [Methanomicrobiales archaeon]